MRILAPPPKQHTHETLSVQGGHTLESGHTGKVEVVEYHRRHEQFAGFGRNRFRRIGEGCDPIEDLQRALMEPKILHR